MKVRLSSAGSLTLLFVRVAVCGRRAKEEQHHEISKKMSAYRMGRLGRDKGYMKASTDFVREGTKQTRSDRRRK